MSRYSEHNIAPHPPLAHKYYHKDESIPCGCATDVRQAPTVVCKYCGAVYDWNAVVSFLSFRCYDCGRYEYDWHKRVADPPIQWIDKGIPMSGPHMGGGGGAGGKCPIIYFKKIERKE